MPNSFTFDQISTILNNIVADAQGRTADITATPRSTADFVTVAQTALSAGTDPIMHSINHLIGKTVFSARSYTGKFGMLMTDNMRFGNAVRKLTPIFADSAGNAPLYDDQPADGQSTDQWTIKRPKTVQTVFVGAEQYQVQAPTVFVDQLNSAFRGPDELARFLSAQMTAVHNELEQQKETLARGTVLNFIGGKLISDTGSVIHLLTEYNALTGLNLDAQSVFAPDNFPGFIKWAYARIETVSEEMTNRSIKWHKSLDNAMILRHTPRSGLRLLMYAPAMTEIKTMVMSGLYHNDLLTMQNHEAVDFWQNSAEGQKDKINVTARYTGSDGSVNTGTISQSKVFAVLYDVEAMGANIFNETVSTTPKNAKGNYYNSFYSFAKRYFNDFTENGAIFLLD